MQAISENRRIVEWQALQSQYPAEFEWDGDTYTGRVTDSRQYSKSPVWAGMIQEQGATLYCLRSIFTDGMPGEGDIIRYKGLGWRIASISLVMDFGVIYQLASPEKR